jgi:hypothetical protein
MILEASELRRTFPALAPEDRRGFRDYVARTLFVQAWADWVEQYGDHYAPGTDLMTAAPETPEYALFEEKIAPLEEIFERARKTWTGKRRESAFIDELAYSLTMSSLGHGVGWEDYNDHFEGCRGLVHFEFTYYDLDDENYPIPVEEV